MSADRRERAEESAGELRRLVAAAGGDLYAAVRAFTGCTTRGLADRLGHSRRTLEQALGKSGRDDATYAGVLRSIEAALKLPQGSLDDMR